VGKRFPEPVTVLLQDSAPSLVTNDCLTAPYTLTHRSRPARGSYPRHVDGRISLSGASHADDTLLKFDAYQASHPTAWYCLLRWRSKYPGYGPSSAGLAGEFAASPEHAALAAFAYALPFALIQPILGPVGDAVGKPGVIRAGLAMLAVFTLASPLAPGLGTLLVLRALAGAAWAASCR
jgi:hypothetical protein